jgi:hypothetical protein
MDISNARIEENVFCTIFIEIPDRYGGVWGLKKIGGRAQVMTRGQKFQ